MKNQHGIECPVNWSHVHEQFNWVSIDWDGRVYAHETEPYLYNGFWFQKNSDRYRRLRDVSAPLNASQCLWQRPKP